MKKVLILAANPKQTTPLRLDRELRDIQAGLKRSVLRDDFELTYRHAVRPRDIQRALLDERPQIIHFSGHGEGENGLIFENNLGNIQLVTGEALANLLNLFSDNIECVLLNGCYSKVQAEIIVQHIDYVIGMNNSISDAAAIEFATAFYDALGAGETYEFAYKFACVAIPLNAINSTGSGTSGGILPGNQKSHSLREQLIPILLKRPGLIEPLRYNFSGEDVKDAQVSMGKSLEFDVVVIQRAGQERLETLDRKLSDIQGELQIALPEHYQEGLNWLKNHQKDLSVNASSRTIAELSNAFNELSEEEKDDFQWDIEKYIESVYYAVSDSSFEILHEPVIGPSINIPEAYQIAFSFIKKKVPSRLNKDIIGAIVERFDYLLRRLFSD